MSRIAYVNGRYRPHRDASVHIEDRGFQFADGAYEVCEVKDGRLVDERRHTERLQRSLAELRLRLPMTLTALSIVLHETVRRNRVDWGIVYLQITRGVATRRPRSSSRQRISIRAATRRSRATAWRSSPCRTTDGGGWTSSRCRSCPTCSPSR